MSLIHWVWLSRLGLHPAAVRSLLDDFRPEELFTAEPAALAERMDPRIVQVLTRRDLSHARKILDDCAARGIRVLPFSDALYPEQLRCTEDPPAVLYVRGTMPDLDGRLCVAVVGTRRADDRTLYAVRRLSAELADAGAVIVSGLALGVDGFAHAGALDAGGTTVAVLGCGADVDYPASNRGLRGRIMETGAVVTEYPPGTEPFPKHFPERNRIVAGISHAVLVASAPAKSGSLITARLGMEQGRDVFVLPGGMDDPMFEGSLAFLKEGGTLATCAEDILGEYRGRFPLKTPEPRPLIAGMPEGMQVPPRTGRVPASRRAADARMSVQPEQEPAEAAPAAEEAAQRRGDAPGVPPAWLETLEPGDRKIAELLLGGELFIEELAQRAEMPVGQLLGHLSVLELMGYIEQKPGSVYAVRAEA